MQARAEVEARAEADVAAAAAEMELRRGAWRAAAAERAAADEDQIRKIGAEELEKHVRREPRRGR